ncbi:MAG: hypothetical protein ACI8WB_005987 [Phenylobacterium sp.]|jgi:hypothetical protein
MGHAWAFIALAFYYHLLNNKTECIMKLQLNKKKIKLNKKALKNLSQDDKALPMDMTPDVAGGWVSHECLSGKYACE